MRTPSTSAHPERPLKNWRRPADGGRVWGRAVETGIEQFLAGALAASLGWAIVARRLAVAGRRVRDREAASPTRALVDAVPQWLAVHDLPLAGRTVDHVVVTPLAVLAIETVWWGEASPAVHDQRRGAATERAGATARALKHLLASRDLGFELPVWPVVVAWGPGAEPTQLGKVDVVAGEAAGAWIATYQKGAIHSRLAADVHAALLRHQARGLRNELDERRSSAA